MKDIFGKEIEVGDYIVIPYEDDDLMVCIAVEKRENGEILFVSFYTAEHDKPISDRYISGCCKVDKKDGLKFLIENFNCNDKSEIAQAVRRVISNQHQEDN